MAGRRTRGYQPLSLSPEDEAAFAETVAEDLALAAAPSPRPRLQPGDRRGELYGVPEQRPHFLPRVGLRDRIREALLSGGNDAVGRTGPSRIGVFGQGGVGKTVCAIDLVHDDEDHSLADACLAAVALQEKVDAVATFDRKLIRLLGDEGLESAW